MYMHTYIYVCVNGLVYVCVYFLPKQRWPPG